MSDHREDVIERMAKHAAVQDVALRAAHDAITVLRSALQMQQEAGRRVVEASREFIRREDHEGPMRSALGISEIRDALAAYDAAAVNP